MTEAPKPFDVFRSREELLAYFEGDKITCLICNQSMIMLSMHLHYKHQITADDYRTRFGIPQHFGLAGQHFRKRASLRMRDMIEKGVISTPPAGVSNEHLKTRAKRQRPAFVQDEDVQKLVSLRGGKVPWRRDQFEEFIARVESGRTATSVGADVDMPRTPTFLKYLRKHPDLKAKYEAAREGQPFEIQVRTRKTGAAYVDAVKTLREAGLGWPEISKILTVKVSTLRNVWHRLKRKEAVQS